MCFHTLSASIAQKTVEIFWIEFYSQKGGLLLQVDTPQNVTTFQFEIICVEEERL